MTFVTDSYAAHGLVIDPGSLPAAPWAAWISNWVWVLGIAGFLNFLPLLFPDGKLPSPRWRPFAWVSCAYVALAAMVLALGPEIELDGAVAPVRSPIGVEGVGGLATWVDTQGSLVFLVLALASGMSLLQRYRKGGGAQRQQIKWFVFAMALLMSYFLVTGVLEAGGADSPGDTVPGRIAAFVAILTVPVAIGISILKYRLYDIDQIINRTLVYGALTAVLALVYLGGVVGLGGLVRDATSSRESNSLVVAASTLGVAALFRPARARIQGFIDRRFYRRKYDATKTLEAFSVRLRDQVSLDSLTVEVITVVEDTMQPAHVSLWLRTPGAL